MLRPRFSELILFLLAILIGGCRAESPNVDEIDSLTWSELDQSARGTTVRLAMWDGDPMINAYMRDFIAPQLKSDHGIELKIIGGQGNHLIDKLMVELEAGKRAGDIDLMWINGETFYQLRQLNALYGPYTERLPNNQFIDWDNPFVAYDFQQPVEGYECPWGNVQLALIYHSERVENPPRNMRDLAAWVKAHPGRFTLDNSFTGMTFLKSLMYEIAGGPGSFDGDFDETKYRETSEQLWVYLKDLKPNLWRKGEVFPEGVAQLHQLFANNEVDFTMSNNDGEVDNKAMQGVLPEAARGYVLDGGTIRNSHYLGIPINAPNKAGAMILANLMISPEAQWKKAQPAVWGDGTVLDINRLPEDWQAKFRNIPGRTRVEPREDLEKNALMEPAPELMVRLHEDFRRIIIEGN